MDAGQLAREIASHHTSSFGWALACSGRDPAVASDVLQQAYWKVLEGKARFDGRSSLKTWFFGVIRMTAFEHHRSTVRWLGRTTDDEAPVSSSAKPDRATTQKQTAERLSRALASLAPRQREVLHLVFYEELSIADAATIMGVSLGSARQHYDRGKKNIKELIRDDE